MINNFSEFINEGFTIDDEIAAIYTRIFYEGKFEEGDEEFEDINIWNSLSKSEQDNIILNSKFTGFINKSDILEIYRIVPFNILFDYALDCVENRIANNNEIDWDNHVIISYSNSLIGSDGNSYKYFDISDTDIESNPFIRKGKNVKWKNRIISQNIEWMLENVWDNMVYIKSTSAIKALIQYTGFSYYKNGKKIM